MGIGLVAGLLLRRSVLVQAASLAMAAGGAAYYLTHPQRVVPEMPEDLASEAQHVHITAQDGTRLHGIWIPGRDENGSVFERTIIHNHGFNSCGGVILARRRYGDRSILPEPRGDIHPVCAWPLLRAGLRRRFNFLLVDLRAHGASGGAWESTGKSAMVDLIGWGRWLRDEHRQLWVGVWGHSFGAAIALAVANRAGSGGLDAMVLESTPVTSRGIYEGVFQKPAYWAVQPVIHRLANHELLPSLRAHRTRTPILLIHDELDRVVPTWQSKQVFELIDDPDQPGRAEFWLVPDADHLQALEVAKEEYIRRTLDWFDKWM